jgi:hypothetical protein
MRDYSSISPSAKGLLLMKGLTDIPFMAEAAELVTGRQASAALDKRYIDDTFLKRLIHFEARYKSINNLLDGLSHSNILELSSGFSFRGLQKAITDAGVTYIDTDLPGVIADKNDLTAQLIAQKGLDLQGELLLMPLNVLDEENFIKTVDQFPAGPLSIVNEGLLMYLGMEEKAKLCQIIHKVLSKRGGCWITADIYIKKENYTISPTDPFSQFLQAHNVEDNKFDSFEQAEQFFRQQGFKLLKKADPVLRELSALKYIPTHEIATLAGQARRIGNIRESWALAAV